MEQVNLYEQMIQHDLFLNPGSSKFEVEEKIKNVELEARQFVYKKGHEFKKYIAEKISNNDIIFDPHSIIMKFTRQGVIIQFSYCFGARTQKLTLKVKVSNRDLSYEEFADEMIKFLQPTLNVIVDVLNKQIDKFIKTNHDVSYCSENLAIYRMRNCFETK